MKMQARILGIIAAVAALLIGVLNAAIGLFVIFALRLTDATIEGLAGLQSAGAFQGSQIYWAAFAAPLLAVVAAVLGIAGASGLKRGRTMSWLPLIISGALCLAAAIVIFAVARVGWVYIADAALFLAGGIMAASGKKQTVL